MQQNYFEVLDEELGSNVSVSDEIRYGSADTVHLLYSIR